jgi:hypothetical protein
MPSVDVSLIEQRLGLTLPAAYRALLLAYPQRLHDTKLDLGWAQEPISERKLYGDAERVIAENLDVRQPGTPWVGEEGGPWPRRMFVIGDDQCGNYWCLDLDGGGDAVWFYNHEVGGFEPCARSLAEYVENTVRDVQEFNRDKANRSGHGGPAAT